MTAFALLPALSPRPAVVRGNSGNHIVRKCDCVGRDVSDEHRSVGNLGEAFEDAQLPSCVVRWVEGFPLVNRALNLRESTQLGLNLGSQIPQGRAQSGIQVRHGSMKKQDQDHNHSGM